MGDAADQATAAHIKSSMLVNHIDAATVAPPVVTDDDSADSDSRPDDRGPLPKVRERPKKKAWGKF